MKNGTPKTLSEAIENGLFDIALGDSRSTDTQILTKHVKDYLAQKFGVAALTHQECEKVLMELFKETVR